jgi:hypothetical protein
LNRYGDIGFEILAVKVIQDTTLYLYHPEDGGNIFL